MPLPRWIARCSGLQVCDRGVGLEGEEWCGRLGWRHVRKVAKLSRREDRRSGRGGRCGRGDGAALAIRAAEAKVYLPGGPRSQLPPAPFDKAMVTVVPLISWWYHWLCEAARARAGGAGEGEGRSAELPDICKSWLASGDTVTAGGASPWAVHACMARMSQLCSRCDVPRRQCRRRQVGRGSGLHAVLLSSG